MAALGLRTTVPAAAGSPDRFMQIGDPDTRPEYEPVLDELVKRKWISAWGRTKGRVFVHFTELGMKRAAWLRIIDDELNFSNEDMDVVFGIVRKFVGPKRKD
jgi:hypothetical protein